MRLCAGDQVDHYTLVKPLGQGGQGSVWQVVDPRAGGVTRALKLVRVEETGRAGFERARREAKILAAAKHPALVRCHGFFEDLDAGLVGLVMDLVSGASLADAAEEGRLDRAHALAALQQIASALAYIHGARLVHRDIKPDNVLLAEAFWRSPGQPGSVKLVDFGIAARTGNPTPLTSVGAVVGTLPYLAPELIDPATWGRTEGPARDLFAFGVLAWEILFRRHPTGLGPDASMIDFGRAYKAAEAGRIAWPPAGLDGPWAAGVGACLALRHADRPASGAALCEILGRGTAARPAASVLAAVTTPHKAAMEPASLAEAAPAKGSGVTRLLGWAAVLLGFLGAMLAVAFVLLNTGWFESLGPHPSPFPPSEVPTGSPPAPSARLAPAPPPVASGPDLGACCPREISTCSGPTHFACPDCTSHRATIPRRTSWKLRVEGARLGQDDLVKNKPAAALTMRLGASTRTLPLARIVEKRAGEAWLPVTTEEVEGGGVHFTLTEGSATLADGAGRIDPTKGSTVKVSALCAGLLLSVEGPGGPVVLSIYLDPTDPAP